MPKGFIYDSAFADAFSADLDFEHDSFNVLLLSSLYVPNRSKHSRRSDLIGEIEGKGYDAGGRSIGISLKITPSKDDPKKSDIDLIVEAAEWLRATITSRYAVVYKRTGRSPAFDPLIACLDFETVFISTAGPFSVGPATLRVENRE